MPIGRMMMWSWILFVLFVLVACIGGPAIGASAGASAAVLVIVIFVVGAVLAFVYGMYLSLRVIRSGDPRLLKRGIHGTAVILSAKQTNTVVQEGEFAWQAPFIWKYHLRAELPDREPYETDASICAADLQVGSTVNIAAAPHNRKRVTIDVGQLGRKERRHAAAAQQSSTEDQLRQLVERRERGELTNDEYESQKQTLLGS